MAIEKYTTEYCRQIVRNLRESRLRAGFPFMITPGGLPQYHFYQEYPDGSIKLLYLCASTKEFKLVRTLSDKEADALRSKLKFEKIN
jgi:hypothetical protein